MNVPARTQERQHGAQVPVVPALGAEPDSLAMLSVGKEKTCSLRLLGSLDGAL